MRQIEKRDLWASAPGFSENDSNVQFQSSLEESRNSYPMKAKTLEDPSFVDAPWFLKKISKW